MRTLGLVALTSALIVLKATGTDIDWLWVFLPLWIMPAAVVSLVAICVSLLLFLLLLALVLCVPGAAIFFTVQFFHDRGVLRRREQAMAAAAQRRAR
jgi:hypothetical protein